jgi:hypothetical protein
MEQVPDLRLIRARANFYWPSRNQFIDDWSFEMDCTLERYAKDRIAEFDHWILKNLTLKS